MLALALSAALAMPQTPPATAMARRAYGLCLNKMVRAKVDAHLSPDAFEAAAKSGCAAEEAAFRQALIAEELALRLRRADAENDASSQIADYLANAVETYTEFTTPR